MEAEEWVFIEDYIEGQILNLAMGIVGRTSRKFDIPKDEAIQLYKAVRKRIKTKARNRGLVYLLIGTPFLIAGLLGTFRDTDVILYGAILTGLACVITAIGLFRLAL